MGPAQSTLTKQQPKKAKKKLQSHRDSWLQVALNKSPHVPNGGGGGGYTRAILFNNRHDKGCAKAPACMGVVTTRPLQPSLKQVILVPCHVPPVMQPGGRLFHPEPIVILLAAECVLYVVGDHVSTLSIPKSVHGTHSNNNNNNNEQSEAGQVPPCTLSRGLERQRRRKRQPDSLTD